MDVTREQVVAHRIAAQGLHRDGRTDALLDLGLQHHAASVPLALAARTAPGEGPDPTGLPAAWTHRGAPYRHRPGALAALAAASRPLSDADAAARLAWSGPEQRRVGIPAVEAIERTADALVAVVTEPMTKGAVSTEVTRRLPAALLRECRACACTHVNEQLMRLAGLPAGVGLDVDAPALLLVPPPADRVRPAGPDPAAAAELVLAVLRVLGPATGADVAAAVGTTRTAFAGAWDAARPALTEVTVDGATAWLPTGDVDALAAPPEPRPVRLLPPFDPLLAGRDRAVLVPEEEHRQALYRALGNPGAVLADGRIVGTWRPRAGRTLALEVTTFAPLPGDVRAEVDAEAERVAAARGLTLGSVVVS